MWTNSDRVFAWMLRHLPFVRQDFSRVRSDEYPIRLWTVAVFLFGALPLLRKRGIGRLLDRRRVRHDRAGRATAGSPTTAALYDQSRFFDDELTRYFQRKGWGICQFSILRPLSELLVQKVLAERYPDLLRHQVSCHADPHRRGQAVRPCGRCEKCRRIVGMLVALDADPAPCGYTPGAGRRSASRPCRRRACTRKRPAARQLAHMLVERGLIPGGDVQDASRPEPLPKLWRCASTRCDRPSRRSREDLRAGVYGLFLEHADGALIKSGRLWRTYDPLERARAGHALPVRARDRAAPSPRRALTRDEVDSERYLLAELTWPEAEARFKQVDVALLPVGAVEQHGPHLPLDTDAFDADYLARRVAEACSTPGRSCCR